MLKPNTRLNFMFSNVVVCNNNNNGLCLDCEGDNVVVVFDEETKTFLWNQ